MSAHTITFDDEPPPLVRSAHDLILDGYSVVPVRGKRPLVEWKNGGTVKHEQVTSWAKSFASRLDGWAIVTGSGLVVLDIDPVHGGDEANLPGALPVTLSATTPSGGRHYYFADESQSLRNTTALWPGVDVRGGGGIVVAPNGGDRTWRNEGTPLAPAPDWLVAALHDERRGAAGGAGADYTPRETRTTGKTPRDYALDALSAACQEVRRAPDGDGNNTLNRQAFSVARYIPNGYLAQEEVRTALLEAALAIGMPQRRSLDTIHSGITSSLKVEDRALTLTRRAAEPADEDADLEREKRRLRINNRARAEVAAEEATAAFRPPTFDASLKEALARPRPPLPYTVADLHPTGSNTLIAAQFKAGKTTLMLNLIRSLVDERPFLEMFPVARPAGRVAYWNYELTDDQFIDYIRPLEIENADLVAHLSFRGQTRLDLRSPVAFDWAVSWLKDQDIAALVLDPYGAAAMLANENDNSEARAWLALVDDLKAAAGVADLWMPAHTGRGEKEAGGEHVRGATVVDDWADVRWLYTKQKSSDGGPDYRYLRAEGRGVAVSEREVRYAPPEEGGYLYIGEVRSRARARAEGGRAQVLAVVGGSPGLNRKEVLDAMRGDSKDRHAALRAVIDAGLVEVRKGPKNASLHHLTPAGEAAALMG